jgi:hypothetical protein
VEEQRDRGELVRVTAGGCAGPPNGGQVCGGGRAIMVVDLAVDERG